MSYRNIHSAIDELIRQITDKFHINEIEMQTFLNSEIGEDISYTTSKTSTVKKSKKTTSTTAATKCKFPIPFCPEHISDEKCKSLSLNNGLYTQCGRKTKTEYCGICTNKRFYEKYGTIQERLDAYNNNTIGLYGFKTPEGMSPVPYMNLTKNASIEEIKEELSKYGYDNVPEEHFTTSATTSTSQPNKRSKKPVVIVQPINPPSTEDEEDEEDEEETSTEDKEETSTPHIIFEKKPACRPIKHNDVVYVKYIYDNNEYLISDNEPNIAYQYNKTTKTLDVIFQKNDDNLWNKA